MWIMNRSLPMSTLRRHTGVTRKLLLGRHLADMLWRYDDFARPR